MTRKMTWPAALGLSIVMIGVGCSDKSKPDDAPVDPPKATAADESLVTYAVTGMTCSNCEDHLTEALGNLANVTQARASHKQEKVWIVVKGDAPTREAVRKAVEADGDRYKLGEKS